MTAKGIDISKWQVETPSLAGRAFVFVRATFQTSEDVRFNMHARAVQKAGKVLGAYHFGTGGATPRQQAKAFLAAVADRKPTLLVLDLENNAAGKNMTKRQAKLFIGHVKRLDPLKRKVGLYASDAHWPGNLGQDFNWVARWLPDAPARPWAFWQYRGNPLDLNEFNGTRAELLAFAGTPVTVDPPAEPEAVYTQTQLDEKIGEAIAAVRFEHDTLRRRVTEAVAILTTASDETA